MKVLVGMLLAVIATASSTTASAEDTLRIVSYRDIETCGNEQRWLIAAYMGAIREQDSLQSFDITIGYDAQIIRPTDGLIVGTLADQMRFGDLSPIFNFTVPGEIRVGAFTITRNVNGNLPLFAVAGSYNGDCGSQTSFTFPWPLEFNPEFKRTVAIVASDTIRTKATPKSDASQGSEVEIDTLVMGTSISDTVHVRVDQKLLRGQQIIEHVQLSNVLGAARIVSIQFDSNTTTSSIEIDSNGLVARVQRTASEDTAVIYHVVVERTTNLDTLAAQLYTRTDLDDACGCTRPTKRDSVTIIGAAYPTSIEETVFHEGAEIEIDVRDDIISIQNHHGQPASLRVATVDGCEITRHTVQSLATMEVQMTTWARGMYIVHVYCCGTMTTKKITR